MSATTISAMSVTDDDGTGTTGTIWNASFQSSFEANINAVFSATGGLRLNQGGGDNAILSLESSDVAHGMTSIEPTDVFGRFVKASPTTGALAVTGLGESTEGLVLQGYITTATTAKTTGSIGAVRIAGFLKSGTSGATTGANANLLSVEDANTVRFILDSDGDSHQDVGTAWTNFDTMDDVSVLHALSVAVSRDGDPLKAQFARYLESHRDDLERGRFVTFNDNGHHFVNWSRVHMLVIGAVRQLGMRLDAIERALPGAGHAALEG